MLVAIIAATVVLRVPCFFVQLSSVSIFLLDTYKLPTSICADLPMNTPAGFTKYTLPLLRAFIVPWICDILPPLAT